MHAEFWRRTALADCVVGVFEGLGRPDLCSAALVCKAWRRRSKAVLVAWLPTKGMEPSVSRWLGYQVMDAERNLRNEFCNSVMDLRSNGGGGGGGGGSGGGGGGGGGSGAKECAGEGGAAGGSAAVASGERYNSGSACGRSYRPAAPPSLPTPSDSFQSPWPPHEWRAAAARVRVALAEECPEVDEEWWVARLLGICERVLGCHATCPVYPELAFKAMQASCRSNVATRASCLHKHSTSLPPADQSASLAAALC